ncbi:MAG TPA: glycosyltransferase family 39 protein [Acidimicrobiales bacterium]|nr:glycosyltransferase family 39 protein [Acidimicrobiales bacterium]
MKGPSRKFWIGLAIVLIAGLGLRIWYVTTYEFAGFKQFGKQCQGQQDYKGCTHFFNHEIAVGIGGDALYYHDQAHLLLSGKFFILPSAYYTNGKNEPSASHPPLYTIVLAGEDLLGLTTVDDQRIAGCILGDLSVLVIALAARRIFGNKVSLAAALVGALYPGLWIFDGTDMSEVVSILAVAYLIHEAYRFWKAPTRRKAAWLGVVVALTSYARSELILLEALVVFPLCLFAFKRSSDQSHTTIDSPSSSGPIPLLAKGSGDRFGKGGKLREPLVLVSISIAGLAIALGPWIGFNMARFTNPELLSTQLGMTIAVSNCKTVYYGEFTGFWDLPTCLIHRTPIPSIGPPPKHVDESVLDSYWRKVGLNYIGANLSRLPQVIVAREGRVWWLYQSQQQVNLNAFVEQWNRGATEAFRWTFYLLTPFAVVGLFVMRRKFNIPISPLLGPVIVVCTAVFITYGTTRFQSAAEPSIVAASAAGIVWLSEQVFGRSARLSK